MHTYELKLPSMGESVAEATLTTWLLRVGDTIQADDVLLEVATDKVDSEVVCEVSGIVLEQRFQIGDIIKVGDVVAVIQTEQNNQFTSQVTSVESSVEEQKKEEQSVVEPEIRIEQQIEHIQATLQKPVFTTNSPRFYSPLVKNIAVSEGLSDSELDQIVGTGNEGRVTKNDILSYVSDRKNIKKSKSEVYTSPTPSISLDEQAVTTQFVSVNGANEIVEMDRMRKLIAHHMRESVETSVHVQSFMEADVTNIWNWRNTAKDAFEQKEGIKLTFTPIFMLAVAKALKDFPMMNISVEGDKIIKKKQINIGMATALSSGNLIVPVIKNADQLSLVGMATAVNDYAVRAKSNKLKPDDITEGTFTVSNIGSFGSLFGTPIINQPQVGILALGAIRKVPAVVETPQGDFIGIRHKMFITHAYDHRVVDGALGGFFLKRVVDYLENWNAQKNCF